MILIVESNIYSVTSFTELRRNAMDVDRWNMLNQKTRKKSVLKILYGLESPILASTDYMKA